MSVWGPGPFENDDAADWLSDLEEEFEEEQVDLFEDVFSEVAASENVGYIEITDGAVAVAAAQVLALLLGRPGVEKNILGEETLASLSQTIGRLGGKRTERLVKRALTAVDRILNDKENSELHQVLEEDEQMSSAWVSRMRDLHDRLQAIATDLEPGGPAKI
jgi:hypothetical protein